MIREAEGILHRHLKRVGLKHTAQRDTILRTFLETREHLVAFHDGIARYEHQYNRRSHHHMVCTECGSSVEFFSPEVDALEQQIGRKYRYVTTRHTFQIYGVCEDCRKKDHSRQVI
jgi:Fur family ferric uptake transcriptional regulator